MVKTPEKCVTLDDDFSPVIIDVRSTAGSRHKVISESVGIRRSPRVKKIEEPVKRITEEPKKIVKRISEQPHEAAKIPAVDLSNWQGCYRSNLITIVNKFSTIQLRPAHIVCLQSTPFWKLFEAMLHSKIDQRKCRKFEEFVIMVIRSYEKNHSAFRLGNKLVKLTRSDVQLIFGIDCGKKEIDFSKVNVTTVEFVKWRGISPAQRLTTKNINMLIDQLLPSEKDEDVKDVVRLLCLHLCQSLFFSTSGTAIGWGYVKIMEDLDIIKEYDWADLITSTVMASIHTHYSNPQKITGCVLVLLVRHMNCNDFLNYVATVV